MNPQIKFKDLSIWIKVALIGGWISIISFTIGFVIGAFGG